MWSDPPPPEESGEGGDGSDLSFDEAGREIAAEADREALERTAGSDAEEEKAFDSKRGDFASMKDKIRSRASDLGVEKSVATKEAIKVAEKRARLRQVSPTLDLSIFADDTPLSENKLLLNPEDELTEEERSAIDPVGFLPLFEQAASEFKETAFPGPLDIAKTVGFMFVTFAVSATFILKSDEFLRATYIAWGFLPGPGANLDYTDLGLPEDWDKDLDNLTGVLADVISAAKQTGGAVSLSGQGDGGAAAGAAKVAAEAAGKVAEYIPDL